MKYCGEMVREGVGNSKYGVEEKRLTRVLEDRSSSAIGRERGP